MNVSVSQIQYSISIFILGGVLSQFFHGVVSDRVGRRSAVLLGVFLTVLGSLVCLMSRQIEWFLLGRFLQGFGAGAGVTVGRSIMRDMYSKEALARIASFVGVGSIVMISVAPFIAGIIQVNFGFYPNLVLLFCYTVFVFLMVWIFLPESKVIHMKPPKLKDGLGILSGSKSYIGYCLIAFLSYGCIAAMITIAPMLYISGYGLSPAEYGLMILFLGMVYAVSSIFNGLSVKRFGMIRLLSLGIILMILGAGIVFIFSEAYSWLVLTVGIYIIIGGAALIFPNITSSALTPHGGIAGIASGILTFSQILGGLVFSVIVASVGMVNQSAIGLLLLIAAILTMSVMIFFIGGTAEK